jgi:hypothetical protein
MGEIMLKSSIFYATDKVLQHHRNVWVDATHCEIQMAIGIMVTMGTNLTLNNLYLKIDRKCAIQLQRNCAYYILQLEQYNNGNGDLRVAALRSRAAMRRCGRWWG